MDRVNRPLNMFYLGKYLSNSFEILEAKTTKHYAKDLEKILVDSVML